VDGVAPIALIIISKAAVPAAIRNMLVPIPTLLLFPYCCGPAEPLAGNGTTRYRKKLPSEICDHVMVNTPLVTFP
jgi:hypothetical protein